MLKVEKNSGELRDIASAYGMIEMKIVLYYCARTVNSES
jgi:hypothetical protein